MNSVVEKLSEIESTAEAIVEHAESQKYDIEQKLQETRDKFDEKLEAETQEKLEQIRTRAAEKMEQILAGQRAKNQAVIDALKVDFEKNHTLYAKEILNHITEV